MSGDDRKDGDGGASPAEEGGAEEVRTGDAKNGVAEVSKRDDGTPGPAAGFGDEKTLPFGSADLSGGTGEEKNGEAGAVKASPDGGAVDGSEEGRGAEPEDAEEEAAAGAEEVVAGKQAAEEESAKGDSAEEESADGSAAEARPGDRGKEEAEADGAGQSSGIRVVYYGRTDVGLIREHNEDNFIVADVEREKRGVPEESVLEMEVAGSGAVFAVCDGMGGAAAGEVASQMAVDTIYEYFTHLGQPRDRDHFAQRVVTAIEEAGGRIFSAAKMDRSRRGMGTTATLAGLMDKVLFVGQVGDSRAYVLRQGELAQTTKDQSLVNQLIEAGQLTEEEAEAFEHSNIILQALGTTEEVTVDLTFLELRRGDRLMLCSDGLSGLVHPEMIKDVLSEVADPVECSKRLIEMANAGGGHDNITVVVADFGGDGLAEPTGANKVIYQQYPLPPDAGEERESLPPRETKMKEGARKPGADVKREREDQTPIVGTRSAEARQVEGDRGGNWPLLVAILLIAALALALVILAMGGDGAADEGEVEVGGGSDVRGTPAPGIGAEPEGALDEEAVEVEVRVHTDIEGELFVDGLSHGPLHEGEEIVVLIRPGAYRFEARSGGSVAASELVTVRTGEPAEVSLTLPSGALEAVDEGEVIEESGGTTGGAAGRRQIEDPAGVESGAQQPRGAEPGGRPTGGGSPGVPDNPF